MRMHELFLKPREASRIESLDQPVNHVPHARNPLVVEFREEEVFAPLKNAPGAEKDTPEYVERFMIAQHRKWLEAVGTKVGGGVPVEISPLWALDAEGVAERKDRPAIIDRPTYLGS